MEMGYSLNSKKKNKKQLLSGYDRSISKSYQETKRQKKNEVPAPQGSLDQNYSNQDLEKMAREAGITMQQLLGHEEVEKAVEVWKFQRGKSLVPPD